MNPVNLASIGPLWLVGCGNMGGALLDRWLTCGLPPSAVTVIDPKPRTDLGVRVAPSVGTVEGVPQVLVLAIKPQLLDAVAPAIAERTSANTLLISILAGTRHSTLSERFASQVVRAMPNTPARLGMGTTVLFGRVLEDACVKAEALMAAAGHVHWINDETLFDAVTGLSGSGPAYLFRFIEALEAAGAAAGLPPSLAAVLALETVIGAAGLAASREVSPAALREQVTSPNGTTAAGLAMLDGKGELTRLLTATVAAAAARSRELARS